MTRARFLAAAVAPLVLTPLLFLAVLRSGTPPAPLARTALPQESLSSLHCTWYCHNHGCPHHPVLPAFLSGDEGLFGWTVDALHSWGNAMAPGAPGLGYGAVNLAVFCALWPAGMYGLWLVALRQRHRIQCLRGGKGRAS
jgi:hypothetical protein